MRYYFKITRGYYAWYVGKGAFCFASVERWFIVALVEFLYYMVKVWRHKPVNTLPYEYNPKKYPAPPQAESVTAAATEPVTWDDIPPSILKHYGTIDVSGPDEDSPAIERALSSGVMRFGYVKKDDGAAVDILTGQVEGFTPRPGVEYFECDECGQETACMERSSFSPSGSGCYTAYYECENPACGHTWHVSA